MNEPTIYENITMDDIISQYYRERPASYWEVGRDLWPQICQLKDDAHHYALGTAVRPTLIGVPYRIVDGKGLRLVTEIPS